MKLIHVTTVPDSFGFYRGQIHFLKENGFEVHLVSSPGKLLDEIEKSEAVPVHAIDMPRRLSPLEDVVAIFHLYQLFKKLKPTIVHASFPKGGLLGVIAARWAGVPVVIYGMRGLRFETSIGWKRALLFITEKIACSWADVVIANSFGNKQRALLLRLVKKSEKIRVLGNGSSNGVDALGRFNPQKLPSSVREELRQQYQVAADDCVIGFVGRLVRDKGIIELEEAWRKLRDSNKRIFLVLVGPIELHDPLPATVLERLKSDPKVIFTGKIGDPAAFYAMMDILVLPSYREGFPNTPLEAAAMRLPVVATNIDGCAEAVVDGTTGFLVPVHDSDNLAQAIQNLINDPMKRQELGESGRQRVLEKFNPENIWRDLYKTYTELIASHDIIK
jgi:glycosyltransferase involved in cell wall biosynthesis